MNRRLFAAALVGLLAGAFLGSFVSPPVKNQALDYVMGVARWPLLFLSAVGLGCSWGLWRLVSSAPHSYADTWYSPGHQVLTEAEVARARVIERRMRVWEGRAEFLVLVVGAIFSLLFLAAAAAGHVSIYPPGF